MGRNKKNRSKKTNSDSGLNVPSKSPPTESPPSHSIPTESPVENKVFDTLAETIDVSQVTIDAISISDKEKVCTASAGTANVCTVSNIASTVGINIDTGVQAAVCEEPLCKVDGDAAVTKDTEVDENAKNGVCGEKLEGDHVVCVSNEKDDVSDDLSINTEKLKTLSIDDTTPSISAGESEKSKETGEKSQDTSDQVEDTGKDVNPDTGKGVHVAKAAEQNDVTDSKQESTKQDVTTGESKRSGEGDTTNYQVNNASKRNSDVKETDSALMFETAREFKTLNDVVLTVPTTVTVPAVTLPTTELTERPFDSATVPRKSNEIQASPPIAEKRITITGDIDSVDEPSNDAGIHEPTNDPISIFDKPNTDPVFDDKPAVTNCSSNSPADNVAADNVVFHDPPNPDSPVKEDDCLGTGQKKRDPPPSSRDSVKKTSVFNSGSNSGVNSVGRSGNLGNPGSKASPTQRSPITSGRRSPAVYSGRKSPATSRRKSPIPVVTSVPVGTASVSTGATPVVTNVVPLEKRNPTVAPSNLSSGGNGQSGICGVSSVPIERRSPLLLGGGRKSPGVVRSPLVPIPHFISTKKSPAQYKEELKNLKCQYYKINSSAKKSVKSTPKSPGSTPGDEKVNRSLDGALMMGGSPHSLKIDDLSSTLTGSANSMNDVNSQIRRMQCPGASENLQKVGDAECFSSNSPQEGVQRSPVMYSGDVIDGSVWGKTPEMNKKTPQSRVGRRDATDFLPRKGTDDDILRKMDQIESNKTPDILNESSPLRQTFETVYPPQGLPQVDDNTLSTGEISKMQSPEETLNQTMNKTFYQSIPSGGIPTSLNTTIYGQGSKVQVVHPPNTTPVLLRDGHDDGEIILHYSDHENLRCSDHENLRCSNEAGQHQLAGLRKDLSAEVFDGENYVVTNSNKQQIAENMDNATRLREKIGKRISERTSQRKSNAAFLKSNSQLELTLSEVDLLRKEHVIPCQKKAMRERQNSKKELMNSADDGNGISNAVDPSSMITNQILLKPGTTGRVPTGLLATAANNSKRKPLVGTSGGRREVLPKKRSQAGQLRVKKDTEASVEEHSHSVGETPTTAGGSEGHTVEVCNGGSERCTERHPTPGSTSQMMKQPLSNDSAAVTPVRTTGMNSKSKYAMSRSGPVGGSQPRSKRVFGKASQSLNTSNISSNSVAVGHSRLQSPEKDGQDANSRLQPGGPVGQTSESSGQGGQVPRKNSGLSSGLRQRSPPPPFGSSSQRGCTNKEQTTRKSTSKGAPRFVANRAMKPPVPKNKSPIKSQSTVCITDPSAGAVGGPSRIPHANPDSVPTTSKYGGPSRISPRQSHLKQPRIATSRKGSAQSQQSMDRESMDRHSQQSQERTGIVNNEPRSMHTHSSQKRSTATTKTDCPSQEQKQVSKENLCKDSTGEPSDHIHWNNVGSLSADDIIKNALINLTMKSSPVSNLDNGVNNAAGNILESGYNSTTVLQKKEGGVTDYMMKCQEKFDNYESELSMLRNKVNDIERERVAREKEAEMTSKMKKLERELEKQKIRNEELERERLRNEELEKIRKEEAKQRDAYWSKEVEKEKERREKALKREKALARQKILEKEKALERERESEKQRLHQQWLEEERERAILEGIQENTERKTVLERTAELEKLVESSERRKSEGRPSSAGRPSSGRVSSAGRPSSASSRHASSGHTRSSGRLGGRGQAICQVGSSVGASSGEKSSEQKSSPWTPVDPLDLSSSPVDGTSSTPVDPNASTTSTPADPTSSSPGIEEGPTTSSPGVEDLPTSSKSKISSSEEQQEDSSKSKTSSSDPTSSNRSNPLSSSTSVTTGDNKTISPDTQQHPLYSFEEQPKLSARKRLSSKESIGKNSLTSKESIGKNKGTTDRDSFTRSRLNSLNSIGSNMSRRSSKSSGRGQKVIAFGTTFNINKSENPPILNSMPPLITDTTVVMSTPIINIGTNQTLNNTPIIGNQTLNTPIGAQSCTIGVEKDDGNDSTKRPSQVSYVVENSKLDESKLEIEKAEDGLLVDTNLEKAEIRQHDNTSSRLSTTIPSSMVIHEASPPDAKEFFNKIYASNDAEEALLLSTNANSVEEALNDLSSSSSSSAAGTMTVQQQSVGGTVGAVLGVTKSATTSATGVVGGAMGATSRTGIVDQRARPFTDVNGGTSMEIPLSLNILSSLIPPKDALGVMPTVNSTTPKLDVATENVVESMSPSRSPKNRTMVFQGARMVAQHEFGDSDEQSVTVETISDQNLTLVEVKKQVMLDKDSGMEQTDEGCVETDHIADPERLYISTEDQLVETTLPPEMMLHYDQKEAGESQEPVQTSQNSKESAVNSSNSENRTLSPATARLSQEQNASYQLGLGGTTYQEELNQPGGFTNQLPDQPLKKTIIGTTIPIIPPTVAAMLEVEESIRPESPIPIRQTPMSPAYVEGGAATTYNVDGAPSEGNPCAGSNSKPLLAHSPDILADRGFTLNGGSNTADDTRKTHVDVLEPILDSIGDVPNIVGSVAQDNVGSVAGGNSIFEIGRDTSILREDSATTLSTFQGPGSPPQQVLQKPESSYLGASPEDQKTELATELINYVVGHENVAPNQSLIIRESDSRSKSSLLDITSMMDSGTTPQDGSNETAQQDKKSSPQDPSNTTSKSSPQDRSTSYNQETDLPGMGDVESLQERFARRKALIEKKRHGEGKKGGENTTTNPTRGQSARPGTIEPNSRIMKGIGNTRSGINTRDQARIVPTARGVNTKQSTTSTGSSGNPPTSESSSQPMKAADYLTKRKRGYSGNKSLENASKSIDKRSTNLDTDKRSTNLDKSNISDRFEPLAPKPKDNLNRQVLNIRRAINHTGSGGTVREIKPDTSLTKQEYRASKFSNQTQLKSSVKKKALNSNHLSSTSASAGLVTSVNDSLIKHNSSNSGTGYPGEVSSTSFPDQDYIENLLVHQNERYIPALPRGLSIKPSRQKSRDKSREKSIEKSLGNGDKSLSREMSLGRDKTYENRRNDAYPQSTGYASSPKKRNLLSEIPTEANETGNVITTNNEVNVSSGKYQALESAGGLPTQTAGGLPTPRLAASTPNFATVGLQGTPSRISPTGMPVGMALQRLHRNVEVDENVVESIVSAINEGEEGVNPRPVSRLSHSPGFAQIPIVPSPASGIVCSPTRTSVVETVIDPRASFGEHSTLTIMPNSGSYQATNNVSSTIHHQANNGSHNTTSSYSLSYPSSATIHNTTSSIKNTGNRFQFGPSARSPIQALNRNLSSGMIVPMSTNMATTNSTLAANTNIGRNSTTMGGNVSTNSTTITPGMTPLHSATTQNRGLTPQQHYGQSQNGSTPGMTPQRQGLGATPQRLNIGMGGKSVVTTSTTIRHQSPPQTYNAASYPPVPEYNPTQMVSSYDPSNPTPQFNHLLNYIPNQVSRSLSTFTRERTPHLKKAQPVAHSGNEQQVTRNDQPATSVNTTTSAVNDRSMVTNTMNDRPAVEKATNANERPSVRNPRSSLSRVVTNSKAKNASVGRGSTTSTKGGNSASVTAASGNGATSNLSSTNVTSIPPDGVPSGNTTETAAPPGITLGGPIAIQSKPFAYTGKVGSRTITVTSYLSSDNGPVGVGNIGLPPASSPGGLGASALNPPTSLIAPSVNQIHPSSRIIPSTLLNTSSLNAGSLNSNVTPMEVIRKMSSSPHRMGDGSGLYPPTQLSNIKEHLEKSDGKSNSRKGDSTSLEENNSIPKVRSSLGSGRGQKRKSSLGRTPVGTAQRKSETSGAGGKRAESRGASKRNSDGTPRVPRKALTPTRSSIANSQVFAQNAGVIHGQNVVQQTGGLQGQNVVQSGGAQSHNPGQTVVSYAGVQSGNSVQSAVQSGVTMQGGAAQPGNFTSSSFIRQQGRLGMPMLNGSSSYTGNVLRRY